MSKHNGSVALMTLVAALAAGLPFEAPAQLRPQVRVATTTNDPSLKTTPFMRRSVVVALNGTLMEVDKTANTITVQEKTNRVVQLTAQTKITRDKKPATLGGAVIGEKVTGTYQRNSEGKLLANTIAFGGKAAPSAAKPPATTNSPSK